MYRSFVYDGSTVSESATVMSRWNHDRSAPYENPLRIRWVDTMIPFARLRTSARRPIVFVHVPKTAGTAVTSYLSRRFSSTDAVSPPFVGDYSIFDAPRRHWSLIAGHFTYSRMRHIVPNADYFTFLREPVARAISLYRSWKDPAKMTPQWRDVMDDAQIRLFEWVYRASAEEFFMSDHPAVIQAISNNMTCYLSSDGTPDAVTALHNLRTRFMAFGILEVFNDSVQRMRSAWPWLGPYRVKPQAENRSRVEIGEITPRIRRRLQELNAADIEFYGAARDLFRHDHGCHRAG